MPKHGAPEHYWERYDRFNRAIFEEFFDGAYAHRSVRIDLEDEVIERIASTAGEPSGDARAQLTSAVAPTLCLGPGKGVFAQHRGRKVRWSPTSSSEPPTLALLALLCLVAEEMRAEDNLRAAAYYPRLAERLCGSREDLSLNARLTASHQKDVPGMWNDLNDWLVANPRRGRPTAYPIDSRKLIGPALSQAQVRDADRQKFPSLFEDEQLAPGQDVPEADMKRMLKDWIKAKKPTTSLVRMAASEEGLSQLAHIVCVDLRNWDGSGVKDPVPLSHLKIIARIRRRPHLTLELGLLCGLDDGDASLSVGGVGGSRTQVYLENDPSLGGSRIADPILNSAPRSCLQNTVELTRGDQTVVRKPTPLVVLIKNDLGLMVEQSRAQLGKNHTLLMAEEFQERVTDALAQIARDGWELESSLSGLPEGWVAISDVEVVALGDFSEPSGLRPLIPTGWASVTLQGGFRVPGRARWLAVAPPEVVVSVLDGGEIDVNVNEASMHSGSDDQSHLDVMAEETDPSAVISSSEPEPAALFQLESDSGIVSIDLEAIIPRLDSDGYLLTVARRSSQEVITQQHFELVSPTSWAPEPAGHAVESDPLWPLTASPSGSLQGAKISNPSELESTEESRNPVVAAGFLTPLSIGSVEGFATSDGEPLSDAPECFQTGCFYWLVDDSNRGGVCKYCGRTTTFAKLPEIDVEWSIPPLRTRPAPREDDVLTALSFAGSGSAASLHQIISQVDDASWAPTTRAQTLSALGHIDLTYGNDGRLESWTTAPSVLALRATGEADLCGWRSDALVDLIKRFTADLGGQVSEPEMEEAPSGLTLANLELDELELLASEVSSELESEVTVIENPGRGIANLLPSISSLVEHLPDVVRPGALERLDPGTWKWVRADTTTEPGAYRSSHPPNRYFVFDGTTWRASEARLSRWLVSSPADTRLAVDPESESLVVPLGSRLPGLWERAAVLSSGSLPQKGTSGGTQCHVYAGIEASVRNRLVASLLS